MLIEKAGLVLAELSPATREILTGLYPEWMPVANPVDLFPAMEHSGNRAYTEALRAVCADPNVDAVVFHLLAGGSLNEGFPIVAEIARNSGKPVFGWVMGVRDAVSKAQKDAVVQGIPVFRELSRAVDCMNTVLRRTPALPPPPEWDAPRTPVPEGGE